MPQLPEGEKLYQSCGRRRKLVVVNGGDFDTSRVDDGGKGAQCAAHCAMTLAANTKNFEEEKYGQRLLTATITSGFHKLP